METDETRSKIMKAVPTSNSRPERLLQDSLSSFGLIFSTHPADLPGRPDIVFPTKKVAVFVHGCYWHRHEGCQKTTTPGTNIEFWLTKFAANVERDKRKERQLEEIGWRVKIFWECEIEKDADRVANDLLSLLDA